MSYIDCASSSAIKKEEAGTQRDQPVATRTRRNSAKSGSLATSDLSCDSATSATNNDQTEPIGSKQQYVPSLVGENLQATHIFAKISAAYKKEPLERTENDLRNLEEHAVLIPHIEYNIQQQQKAKELERQKFVEIEESQEEIEKKVDILVQMIKESKHIVFYTGAGISTSASIPDYRGPDGLWTQIKRTGKFSITRLFDLSCAEPTFTHMAIRELCRRRKVKHVVSQNCDGLHLRSGIPQTKLSEIHGNMYIEVCPTCEKQYFRQADVTERTSRFRHKTGRQCHTCAEPNNNLIDTIVLYGERSRTNMPMNWERASKAAKRADLIICLGSSLRTLRRYGCLWPKSSSRREPNTKLVIVNLQYTPKDKQATLKINGKCDFVMQLVMQRLQIQVPAYELAGDPLMELAVQFTPEELKNLNRNLVFDANRHGVAEPRKTSESPSFIGCSATPKRPKSSSPSLFVSELTDDPAEKRLKMTIRAVNVEDADSMADGIDADSEDAGCATTCDEESTENGLDIKQENNAQSCLARKQATLPKRKEYSLPGWLGKSLSRPKTSSYRRKRHGNKGRKHHPPIVASIRHDHQLHEVPLPQTL